MTMELTIKQPKNGKKSPMKTVQFLNTSGVEKVYDIHHYSENGVLFYKRKSSLAVV